MADPTPDPFANVPTELVVDLVLAGETLPDETRQQLYQMVAEARRNWPGHWALRFAEAYKVGLRERWSREIAEELRERQAGGSDAAENA